MKFARWSITKIALPTVTAAAGSVGASATTALGRVGFSFFAAFATAFWVVFKAAGGVTLLILNGVREFLLAIAANNSLVFVHGWRSLGAGKLIFSKTHSCGHIARCASRNTRKGWLVRLLRWGAAGGREIP